MSTEVNLGTMEYLFREGQKHALSLRTNNMTENPTNAQKREPNLKAKIWKIAKTGVAIYGLAEAAYAAETAITTGHVGELTSKLVSDVVNAAPVRHEDVPGGSVIKIPTVDGHLVLTPTLRPTVTARPSNTPAPTEAPATATEVAPDFQLCSIKDRANCQIPAESLIDGSYENVLNSKLGPPKMGTEKALKKFGPFTIFDPETTVTGEAAGQSSYGGWNYDVISIRINGKLIVGIQPYKADQSEHEQEVMDSLTAKGARPAFINSPYIGGGLGTGTKIEDPLLKAYLDKNNIDEAVTDLEATGDASKLSKQRAIIELNVLK